MNSVSRKSQSLSLFSDKLFYKIGEVSKMLDVETYVLRYWESEFPFVKPKRSSSGQRLYTKQDVNMLLEIKKLLYDEKYTIDGVRKRFQKNYPSYEKPENEQSSFEASNFLVQTTAIMSDNNLVEYVKKRLREIVNTL